MVAGRRPRAPRWRGAPAVAAVAGLALLGAGAGCGGSQGDLGRPLSYFPADTPGVALISTEFDDTQWQSFNGTIAPLVLHASVRRLVRETSQMAGLSFGDDVKALLGRPLVVGVLPGAGRALVAALEVRDAGKLAKVLRAFAFAPAGRAGSARLYRRPIAGGTRLHRPPAGTPPLLAVDGDVLVAATTDAALRRALGEPRRAGRLTPEILRRGLHGLPGDALVRVYGSLRRVAARAPAGVPWLRALRSYALAVTVQRHVIEAKGIVRTAAGAINAAQLPLARGRATSPIPKREDEAVVGLRNTAPSAAVVLALLSRGRSPIARRARAAAGVLRQLGGPAFAAFDPDGDVWVRARLRHPRAAARALRAAAPRLGLRPAGGGLFTAGGRGLLVGVVGDVLVAAPDRPGVREASAEYTVTLAGARGGLVARADLGSIGSELERRTGLQLGPLDEAIAYAWADRDGIRVVFRLGIR
jgi:hypothetical protein